MPVWRPQKGLLLASISESRRAASVGTVPRNRWNLAFRSAVAVLPNADRLISPVSDGGDGTADEVAIGRLELLRPLPTLEGVLLATPAR